MNPNKRAMALTRSSPSTEQLSASIILSRVWISFLVGTMWVLGNIQSHLADGSECLILKNMVNQDERSKPNSPSFCAVQYGESLSAAWSAIDTVIEYHIDFVICCLASQNCSMGQRHLWSI
ncbi:MAG: hypothetical protein HQL64_17125 [Magnetococcales bacterium]|nr:hypothetical protein [Magnetococcales bacterium]